MKKILIFVIALITITAMIPSIVGITNSIVDNNYNDIHTIDYQEGYLNTNVLIPTLSQTASTNYGITVVRLDDNTYMLNGTMTSEISQYISLLDINKISFNKSFALNSANPFIPTQTDYVLSSYYVSGTANATYIPKLEIYNATDTNVSSEYINTTTSSAVLDLTINEDYSIVLFVLRNASFVNYTFKVQLEKGTTATAYQPYMTPLIDTFNLSVTGSSTTINSVLINDVATENYTLLDNVVTLDVNEIAKDDIVNISYNVVSPIGRTNPLIIIMGLIPLILVGGFLGIKLIDSKQD